MLSAPPGAVKIQARRTVLRGNHRLVDIRIDLFDRRLEVFVERAGGHFTSLPTAISTDEPAGGATASRAPFNASPSDPVHTAIFTAQRLARDGIIRRVLCPPSPQGAPTNSGHSRIHLAQPFSGLLPTTGQVPPQVGVGTKRGQREDTPPHIHWSVASLNSAIYECKDSMIK